MIPHEQADKMGQSAIKEAAHGRKRQRRRRREKTCLIVSCPTFALHLLTDCKLRE
jgi:hypothetical protein